MAVYKVSGYHHKKAYIKGDLEAEDVIAMQAKCFKTRKEANACLSKIRNMFVNSKYKVNINIVKRGDAPSTLLVFTGDTWVHENTGATHEEFYRYTVTKQ